MVEHANEGEGGMFKQVALLALASSVSGCSQTMPVQERSPIEAIDALGFDALALPTTAYGPGSLVTSVRGNGLTPPFKLTYLCLPKYSNIPPPSIDAAASSQASRAFSGSFKLDATGMAALGLGASISNIESVSIKFDNVKIEQLGFDELRSIRKGLGPECGDTLADFSRQGIAYQTKQAMRADVVYTATFKRGASAEAKGVAIAALKAAFGGSVQSDSASSVQGNGLYYGLVLTKV